MFLLRGQTAASRALRNSSENWRERGGYWCRRRLLGDRGVRCNGGTIQWAIHWTLTVARVVNFPMMRIIISGSMRFLPDTLLLVLPKRDHHLLVKLSLPVHMNSRKLICRSLVWPISTKKRLELIILCYYSLH